MAVHSWTEGFEVMALGLGIYQCVNAMMVLLGRKFRLKSIATCLMRGMRRYLIVQQKGQARFSTRREVVILYI